MRAPKFSILVPSYDPDLKKLEMVIDLIRSIEQNSVGQDYELIIRKNGPSYVESHNDALSTARGEWIIVLNDDIKINDPEWLDKFIEAAGEDNISSWKLWPNYNMGGEMADAAGFCMHRKVFERIGLMDERYKDGFNYEDTDYFLTAKDLGIEFKDAGIDLKHLGNKTFGIYYQSRRPDMNSRNKKLFKEKWPDIEIIS